MNFWFLDRILGHSKNAINRLQFLNNINLIPKALLVSKQTENYVEPIVLDFLKNDLKYGYLIEEDETVSIRNVHRNAIETRMQEFRTRSFGKKNVEETHYKMPEKNKVENV